MHIALCHDSLIPPRKYGGTERVIAWLAGSLNRLGHRTTIVAAPGSHIAGSRMIECSPGADYESLVPADVDILHYWSTPHVVPRRPFLVTIEGNGKPGEGFLANTVFISRKHAENHGAEYFIYNGIDMDAYPCAEKREDYAVFLAKASWKVKNLEGAIAVARKAGLRLEVCGSREWIWGLQRWLPPIRGVRYRGMVDDHEKRDVLSRARALIFPVRWHEPFGIAITEALASGCFVLGTPYGSLPEIVSPDVGVLSDNADVLARALESPERFSPERCRKRVEQGFRDSDMARSYLEAYKSVLEAGRLPGSEGTSDARTPRVAASASGLSAASLLPWSAGGLD
jgi:glycosyltransferase involved in cell wall biosynthesis